MHTGPTRVADRSKAFTLRRYHPAVLEDLNKKAKKAGLHVADAKKRDRYSIRKVKNGKLVAKNVDAEEALRVIKQYK
ncbi:hypothetical protein CXX93_16970 [Gordonia sp. YC-JH1]|nr:hypothetical protein CXX93_16970 [Gordonia sp. YC-JH1]